jgi:hydroxymethylpyrimidine/phosphomethylpyrimidine kinase
LDVNNAVEHAKEHILKSIARSYAPGKGVYMIEQLAPLLDDKEKLNILEKMQSLRCEIEKVIHPSMIPEVGTNFGYAKSHALKREDVCAFDGRIINIGGNVRVLSCPSFGASRHVAGIILSAMKYNPEMRCAINIRYSKDMLNAVKDAKFKISSFSRNEEPKNVSTMEWGTANAIEKYKKENGKEGFPDVIYDEGGLGKEPMIRVLACSPEEILEKLERIKRSYIKIKKKE